MNLGKLLRVIARLRFKLLGLATIRDIPTDAFNSLIATLQDSGWRKTREYDGFDAWIDYGCVVLKKGSIKLKLEWDNWTEGSVEGPRESVQELAQETGFPVVYEWRWAEYDEPRPS